ncbi:MAG: ROK family protein [Oscillospiraceae bacterium]|jgi:glucokinase|nr:ROK family protein [Oscillospiraceae bacterium]
MVLAGLDLGGTKCAAVLAQVQGDETKFLCRKEVPTVGDWRSITDALLAYLAHERTARGVEIAACGISCGGPLDGQRGVILRPPNLLSFSNVAIVDYVQEKLGVPAKLQNDADACALAEWKFGAGRGTRNMIFLTFGTGLGAGLILDGKLYTGARNLAGEVGHMRLKAEGPLGYGKRGSWEGFCSGGGIRAQILQHFGEDFDARELQVRAEQGDEKAVALYHEIGANFGRGLAVLVDLLNPELIVAGSIFARAHSLLYDAAMQALREEALPESLEGFRLRPAQLGNQIGDYAAVAIAI